MKHTPNWPLMAATRFVLASIVVACHLTFIFTQNVTINAISKFSGFAAVAGFLLISGYSISHSIHRKPKGYMKRRFFRIYPCYIACLGVSVALIVAAGGMVKFPTGGVVKMPTSVELAGNALMLQQLVIKPLSLNPVTWTLAVEEMLYLCAPLIVRIPRRVVWGLISFSWLFCAIGPRYGYGYYSTTVGPWGFIALAWIWLLGWQLQTGDGERTRTAILVLICSGVSLAPHGELLAVVTVGLTAFVVIHGNSIRIHERIGNRLSWMGNVSYPLYLIHYPTLWGLWYFTQSLNPLLYVAGALAAAAAIHHGVELPVRRFREWQESRNTAPVVPAVTAPLSEYGAVGVSESASS